MGGVHVTVKYYNAAHMYLKVNPLDECQNKPRPAAAKHAKYCDVLHTFWLVVVTYDV